jgi:hypothetical protein
MFLFFVSYEYFCCLAGIRPIKNKTSGSACGLAENGRNFGKKPQNLQIV